MACIKVNTTNVYLTKSIHLDQLAGIQAQRCIYLVMWPHSWPQDFFFSCRNIQIRVFHANIFKSECFMQKYWSGTVTRYPVMRG